MAGGSPREDKADIDVAPIGAWGLGLPPYGCVLLGGEKGDISDARERVIMRDVDAICRQPGGPSVSRDAVKARNRCEKGFLL